MELFDCRGRQMFRLPGPYQTRKTGLSDKVLVNCKQTLGLDY